MRLQRKTMSRIFSLFISGNKYLKLEMFKKFRLMFSMLHFYCYSSIISSFQVTVPFAAAILGPTCSHPVLSGRFPSSERRLQLERWLTGQRNPAGRTEAARLIFLGEWLTESLFFLPLFHIFTPNLRANVSAEIQLWIYCLVNTAGAEGQLITHITGFTAALSEKTPDGKFRDITAMFSRLI